MAAARYKPYPAYKPSGFEWLGDIPEAWDIRRGKFVFDEVNDRSETGLETLLSVSEYYGVKPRSEAIDEGEFLTRAASLVGYKKCAVNDLAMNIMLAWKRGLGVSNYEGIISPAYSVFRFRKLALPKFMHYLLRTDAYVDHFKSRSTGVIDSRLRMYPETFADIGILLPSLPEQTKIAAFLDYETAKIDALIAKQQRLIALLEEKRQAVISHAVTKGLDPTAPLRPSGIDWLGDVPEHWEVAKCGYYLSIVSGFAFPSSGFSARPTGDRLLRGINVGVGEIRWKEVVYWKRSIGDGLDAFEMEVGDIVLGMDRPIIGDGVRVAKIGPDDLPCLLLQRVTSLKASERLNPDYLLALLSSDMFEAHFAPETTGVSVPHISPNQITNFVIPIPPMIEQNALVVSLERDRRLFDDLLTKAQSAITLLKERRTALISAAVTGKIDVRDWQPPQPLSDTDLNTETLQEAAL